MESLALPSCGRWDHRDWTVVRDGFYGLEPRRRQRYRCFEPGNPANRHRFTPPVVRLEAVDRHCLECESPLDPGQGPNSARRYDFVAREIAAALVAVGNGATYSQAAMTARQSVLAIARHFPAAERPVRLRVQPGQVGPTGAPSRHGTLVASWVETYADVVLGTDPIEMPQVLLLDSTNFWRRSGGRRIPAFSVLFAYGYRNEAAAGELLAAVAYRSANAAAWADLLATMPGQPQVVVCDRAQDIAGGLSLAWPKEGFGRRPEVAYCRWHLAKRLREAITEDLRPHTPDPRKHPLWLRAERAFDDRLAWADYYRVAYRSLLQFDPESLDLPAGVRWLSNNDLLVRTQIARRPHRPGPESTAPLEGHIAFIRERLAGRAQALQNRPRTNQMLRLMVAARNGRADERVWADRIRLFLADHSGEAPPQRQLVGAGGL